MLKIPTFILGGLLILTGLGSYLLQDLGVSIKLSGPLAENAKLTLSDGEESHELDLGYPSSKAAGEQAYWLIERLNTIHSIEASQSNFIADQSSEGDEKKSFWYASSRKETMAALIQDASNYKNANDSSFESIPVKWEEVDVNSSTVKFVYKNEAGNSGPVTLKVSNWTNINMENPPEDNTLEFGKSLTALIPGAIGLVLILLVLGAEAKPGARKHIMHVAVLFGLLGFVMVARQVGSAVAEMNWLRDEPNGIIQASSLKPTAMLISAGLLLIFVILCIVSFVKARKEMAAQAKIDKAKAKKEKKAEEDEGDDPPSKDSKEKNGKKEDGKEKKGLKDPEKRDKNEPKKSKSSEGSENPSKAKDFTDSKSKESSERESSDSSKEKSSSESEAEKKTEAKKEVSHGYKPVDSPEGKLKKDNGSSPDPADKQKEDAKDSPNHSADAPGTGSPSDSGEDADQPPEKKTDEDSAPETDQDSKEEENSSEDKAKDENS
ncbi:hypothetical protein OAK38_00430 [Verrucomicrobia bacterium]|nr:hypothetical protein [Verrucomicrobiota bacterium]